MSSKSVRKAGGAHAAYCELSQMQVQGRGPEAVLVISQAGNEVDAAVGVSVLGCRWSRLDRASSCVTLELQLCSWVTAAWPGVMCFTSMTRFHITVLASWPEKEIKKKDKKKKKQELHSNSTDWKDWLSDALEDWVMVWFSWGSTGLIWIYFMPFVAWWMRSALGCDAKRSWRAALLEVTEQRVGREGEEEVSVLHGWLPWQLPLLWVRAPLHPLPRHSRVAVRPSRARRTLPGHQRSHSAAPATLKALFMLNTWRTNSLNHCPHTETMRVSVSF